MAALNVCPCGLSDQGFDLGLDVFLGQPHLLKKRRIVSDSGLQMGVLKALA